MPDLTCTEWIDYRCLDSGGGRRLERFGPYILSRPSPQAIWRPQLTQDQWNKADAWYERSSSGGGSWHYRTRLPERWPIRWNSLTLLIKTTGFGHVGLFPEQQPHWIWIIEQVKTASEPLTILNLFGYTGAMTLAIAETGAKVCHLDASRGVVDWARENAGLSGYDQAPIRWIVDDALKFISREKKRGTRYDGIIMDPPTYGRGPKGQVFKIEDDMQNLMDASFEILAAAPRFFLISCHTTGLSGLVFENLLHPLIQRHGGTLESGNTAIDLPDGKRAPSGYYARWYQSQPTQNDR